ncbi:amidase [Hyphomonas sp.]|uniref:amidase n=1 Tax=Hyphomonas sp. TaxID=87 RepID=UPI002610421C|nr:amidase [Hyphomonas sp.]MDF1806799.1 amidase [Hyphomonas sp.]
MDHGAFLPGPRVHLAPTGSGPLDGLTFAVKDLIDTAGHVTGGGNPDWAAAAVPASRSATVVESLLAAGACMTGKTVTDELAFSLEGVNAHYGTPVNPADPELLPGGSSSGSAVAVGAGETDFAIGTDTGGSVRVPAAFCGIHAFRPTHGAVPLDGVLPFAPSYDTVGWFAPSADLLRRVSGVLLPSTQAPPISRFCLAIDAFELADREVSRELIEWAKSWGPVEDVMVFEGQGHDWLEAYRVLQGHEIHRSLGPRIADLKPKFAVAIAQRFEDASRIGAVEVSQWRSFRKRVRAFLAKLLPSGTALLLPTAPITALPRTVSDEQTGDFYRRALTLCSIAGHGGLPQRHIPFRSAGGSPVGLSLIGAPNSDLALLAAEPGQ